MISVGRLLKRFSDSGCSVVFNCDTDFSCDELPSLLPPSSPLDLAGTDTFFSSFTSVPVSDVSIGILSEVCAICSLLAVRSVVIYAG